MSDDQKKSRGQVTLSPVSTRFHYDDAEERFGFERIQDTAPILDDNKFWRNHETQTGEFRKTMEIPMILFEKWKNEYGFDFWAATPDEQNKFLDKIKNDPDWAYLRTQ